MLYFIKNSRTSARRSRTRRRARATGTRADRWLAGRRGEKSGLWGACSATCTTTEAYDDFTRVSSYVDWVKDTTRYGPWVVGECSASCGEGTRLDRRTCVGDNCQDSVLHRVSECEMPDCEDGRDVCKELECSPDAVCEEEGGKLSANRSLRFLLLVRGELLRSRW